MKVISCEKKIVQSYNSVYVIQTVENGLLMLRFFKRNALLLRIIIQFKWDDIVNDLKELYILKFCINLIYVHA